jgi:hypothetical protein
METTKNRKKIMVMAIILILSIGNYSRMFGNEPIRTVLFMQIFVIGAISALLIRKIVCELRK